MESRVGGTQLHLAIEVQSRIRELIKLAKEQGYLTFDDLNEALPEGITDADELDLILTRLRRMEIDIIEASEVDRYKDGKKDAGEEEEEEEKVEAKLDILDDPVRMYLKQMGQVPLLTREQEVEISKRIEEAENMVQRHINRFGFIACAHLDLARKLVEGGERFDRVILDKKIESRERYMKKLPHLLPPILPQTESNRGICSPGGRRLPYIAVSSDGASKTSSGSKKTFAAPEQNSRAGKRPVAFAFRICRAIPGAERLGASGIAG